MSRLFDRYGPLALVTGASSGIGEAFARLLAAEGFSLVLTARRGDRLERLAGALGARFSIEVETAVADLSDPSGIDHLFACTEGRGLAVSLIVNNAGFGSFGHFETVPEDWQLGMVDVNCRAVAGIAHRFGGRMLARGRGGMIVTSSVAGFQPTPTLALYGATKAFDLHFGEALWAEWRPRGVDVLTFCPGVTRTEFHAVANMPLFDRAPVEAEGVCRQALKRLGEAPVFTPGGLNQLSAAAIRFLPRHFIAAMGYKVLSRYLGARSDLKG